MYTFGTIPSRRLGRSLGINNIPPKHCSYACVYCQLGKTDKMIIKPVSFYDPYEIYAETERKVYDLHSQGEKIDYLTLVPDGEPTLDKNLGKLISLLKKIKIKIAVITNGSLLWNKEVRNALLQADWVSVKSDTASQIIWRKLNRPCGWLSLPVIQLGIQDFAQEFKGELVTETMLIKNINDSPESVESVARFIGLLGAAKSYLLVPTRPPAENFAEIPDDNTIGVAYHIFSRYLDSVELIMAYEGNDFVFSSEIEKELMSITAVHPMRKDAIEDFLKKAESGWKPVKKLLKKKLLKKINYDGYDFYFNNSGGNHAWL